jgi:uncharacterized protein (TIRG00374 family)
MTVGSGIAIVLVLTFARLVDVGTIWQRLRHLNVGLALVCGLIFLSAYGVRALRWHCFLSARTQGVGIPRLIMIYQVATFVNWLLPLRGGELVKCLLLRRLDDVSMSESLPTVAMDKFMDLLPAAVLLILIPFLPFHLTRPLWSLLLAVLVVLAGGVLFLLLAALRRQIVLRLFASGIARLPRVFQRIDPFVARFLDALLALVARPRLLLRAALLTGIAACLDGLFCLLAFAAVGTPVSFPLALFGYTFFNLAFILPTPPGQVGSNELIGLLIFSGALGVNRNAVAAMFVFSHPWTAILMAASGLLCLSMMGISIRSAVALTRDKGHVSATATSPTSSVSLAGLSSQRARVRRSLGSRRRHARRARHAPERARR